MLEGLSVEFPKENVGFFKELRKTQSRPKVIFETKDKDGNVIQDLRKRTFIELDHFIQDIKKVKGKREP